MMSPAVVDENLLSRLQISRDTLQRLTHFQMTSLKSLLEHPPECLSQAVRLRSAENLRKQLSKLNVPINATEYHFNLLESYLKDLFLDWRLDSRERNRLLSGLAR
jgi:hypothetical protein